MEVGNAASTLHTRIKPKEPVCLKEKGKKWNLVFTIYEVQEPNKTIQKRSAYMKAEAIATWNKTKKQQAGCMYSSLFSIAVKEYVAANFQTGWINYGVFCSYLAHGLFRYLELVEFTLLWDFRYLSILVSFVFHFFKWKTKLYSLSCWYPKLLTSIVILPVQCSRLKDLFIIFLLSLLLSPLCRKTFSSWLHHPEPYMVATSQFPDALTNALNSHPQKFWLDLMLGPQNWPTELLDSAHGWGVLAAGSPTGAFPVPPYGWMPVVGTLFMPSGRQTAAAAESYLLAVLLWPRWRRLPVAIPHSGPQLKKVAYSCSTLL